MEINRVIILCLITFIFALFIGQHFNHSQQQIDSWIDSSNKYEIQSRYCDRDLKRMELKLLRCEDLTTPTKG